MEHELRIEDELMCMARYMFLSIKYDSSHFKAIPVILHQCHSRICPKLYCDPPFQKLYSNPRVSVVHTFFDQLQSRNHSTLSEVQILFSGEQLCKQNGRVHEDCDLSNVYPFAIQPLSQSASQYWEGAILDGSTRHYQHQVWFFWEVESQLQFWVNVVKQHRQGTCSQSYTGQEAECVVLILGGMGSNLHDCEFPPIMIFFRLSSLIGENALKWGWLLMWVHFAYFRWCLKMVKLIFDLLYLLRKVVYTFIN